MTAHRRPAPARWAGVVVGVGAAVLAACGVLGSDHAASPGADDAVGRSSTIGFGTGGSLWVTSPDEDRVLELDAETLEVAREIEVAGQPRELSMVDGHLAVTANQSNDLTLIDPATGAAMAVALPCGGSRAVVGAASSGDHSALAVVTCPTDDLVVVVDLDAAEVIGSASLPGRPTGIVRHVDQITISTSLDGRLATWPAAGLVAGLLQGSLADPSTTTSAWADGERAASLLAGVDVSAGGVVAPYQVVDNSRQLSSKHLEGDASYGNPLNGRARLEPALAGPCGARFADFADPARLLSGPVAVAGSPTDDLVWVVGQFSQSVSVVDCAGGDPSGRSVTVASFEVGAGARGIVRSVDGTHAFVDVGFDHEVVRLDLPEGASDVEANDKLPRTPPTVTAKREVTDRYLSPLAQEGRKMFADATDEHLTPFGVVTCASCHPDAGEDGLSWRIETDQIPVKIRRTPPVWEIDASTKPLHWDGEFDRTDDLVLTTIQELMGGDGLLIDTAAISAYLGEALPPPGAPPSASDGEAVSRGQAIFESGEAGCVMCHVGTTGSDGQPHAVLSESDQAAGILDEVITPTLSGVRGRAPYGHDGRASDLASLFDDPSGDHGGLLELSPAERADVIAYLRSR